MTYMLESPEVGMCDGLRND